MRTMFEKRVLCDWCLRTRSRQVSAVCFVKRRSGFFEPRCAECSSGWKGEKISFEAGLKFLEKELLQSVHES